jgi:uracil-DNA glycosylase
MDDLMEAADDATHTSEPAMGLEALAMRIAACRVCEGVIPKPRPVVRLSATARLCIAGQAPGIRVHQSGLPFDDPSGNRLRQWMGIDRARFYDASRIAIVPMGFCFPGWDAKGADRPPRPECKATWHRLVFEAMPQLETILLIGRYAQAWHLRERAKDSLTETVRAWRDYAPRFIPLPHPSWRNSGWLKANPWFDVEIVPALRDRVQILCG